MKYLTLLFFLIGAAHAEILHQTANMGARGTGSSVSFGDQGNGQYVSATRFEILPGAAAKVTEVGGHMASGNQNTEIFWCLLVKLRVGKDFPSITGDENPIGDSQLVAVSLFGAPQSSPSREVNIPMTANLPPGRYVLAFGAGGVIDDFLLGPGGYIQPSAANVTDGANAGFFLQFPRDGSENNTVLRWNTFGKNWVVDSNDNIRMYVEGELIDSPPPIELEEALPGGTSTRAVSVEETAHFGIQLRRQSGGATDAGNVYTSADYVYTVEVSDDVGIWTSAELQIAFTTPIDHGDGSESTTAYLVDDTNSSPSAKFMRIRVARNDGE